MKMWPKQQEVCNIYTIKAPGRDSGSTNPLDKVLSLGEQWESDGRAMRAMGEVAKEKKARIVPLFGDEDGEERADIGASSSNRRKRDAP